MFEKNIIRIKRDRERDEFRPRPKDDLSRQPPNGRDFSFFKIDFTLSSTYNSHELSLVRWRI